MRRKGLSKFWRIARHYLNEIRIKRPHGSYLVGGYSVAAVVAFEMAQQLKGKGEEVTLLFMLDRPVTDSNPPEK